MTSAHVDYTLSKAFTLVLFLSCHLSTHTGGDQGVWPMHFARRLFLYLACIAARSASGLAYCFSKRWMRKRGMLSVILFHLSYYPRLA
jgi:hypothetical protein